MGLLFIIDIIVGIFFTCLFYFSMPEYPSHIWIISVCGGLGIMTFFTWWNPITNLINRFYFRGKHSQ